MSAKRICIEKDQQTSDDGDKDKKKLVINSLDYDSLAKIIMLLPIPERIDMEKVCTKWKEACQLAWYDIKKYKCESSIGRCYDNRLLTQSYLEKILLRCGNYLKVLSLSDVCDSSIMPFVGVHCQNLTTLECKFYINTLHHYADDFVRAFTQLDKLKCIKITVDHNYSNKIINLSAIIESLPEEINEIHLFSKPIIWEEKPNIGMTFKKFKNLQKLTIQNLCLSNINTQEISEKTALVYLSIHVSNIPKGLLLFSKLAHLEHIDLTGTKYQFVENCTTEILNTIFCTCKNLKHLDISRGPYDVAEIPLKKWINFQNLEYLGIYCNMMPDLANTIVEYCKNLKHLRIHHIYSPRVINNIAIKKLTELKNLESLILFGGSPLKKESVIAISNNCRKLKRLEISVCFIEPSVDGEPMFSSTVLNELSKLQYLEHLNLSDTLHLEDSAIIAIANNCKNLKTLNILGCGAITKTGLDALTNLENLENLYLSFFKIIIDSFLIKLKRLKKLRCHECEKLTEAGIIQVIKNNPDLEFLKVILPIGNITINMVIAAADQITENRTNGIILHIELCNSLIEKASKSIIKSQWLVVK